MFLLAMRFVALMYLVCAATGLLAQESSSVVVWHAIDANDESVRRADTKLEQAIARLGSLEKLQEQGYATWREVAEQRANRECVGAQRMAAAKSATVLRDLLQIVVESHCTADKKRSVLSGNGYDMRRAAIGLAATLKDRQGELEAATIACRRAETRLADLETLQAKQLASDVEVAAARIEWKKSGEAVAHLRGEREAAETWWTALRLAAEDDCDAEAVLQTQSERKIVTVPKEWLRRVEFIGTLVEVRDRQREAEAWGGQAKPWIQFAEELISRLQAIELASDRPHREIEGARSDLAFWRASLRASEERREILRLQEELLIATGDSSAEENLGALVRNTTAVDGSADLLGTHTTIRAWNWPGSPVVFSARGGRAGGLPPTQHFLQISPADNFQATSAAPIYAEYYVNGNRRRDLPPWARNWFFNGGLPWYLPGSSTNFK